uniref:non-specific serine/threonine protein kinase n=1 Tax=Anopheles epiroticus TaxID=199890 RepID=A0A182P186_9DIPT
MPLYSELYHNFVGNTPIIPTPMVSVGASTYSPPTYVGVSRAFPNPLTSASARSAPSFTRGYVPKLTPITETPLTSTRIAALGRVSSPKFLAHHPTTASHHHHSSPTYQKPRRIINTADIDVSASKYASGGGGATSTRSAPLSAHAPINLPEVPPSTARDQELSERSEQRRARSTINRNRTVVRLNTIRARSKSRGSRGSAEGRDRTDAEPTFDEEMLLLEPPAARTSGGGYGASTTTTTTSWRDNFRDELSLRPRTRASEPIKSPGELLLEKHLIREEESAGMEPVYPATRSPVPKRRGTIRRKSAVKIPSFHEICADISSDKLDDDLNAGELRRRASQLIEDELLQFQEELKKAASAAGVTAPGPDTLEDRLKEALEQQIAQDSGVEVAEKRKLKKIKRTRTKVLPVVAGEGEQPPGVKVATEGDVVVENAVAPPRIVAELESIEECTVFKLPKKKKKQPAEAVQEEAKKAIGTAGAGLRKETLERGRAEAELQQVEVVILDRPANGVQGASKQASTGSGATTVPSGGAGLVGGVAAEPRKTAKAGIKTYVRKKTVETLPEPLLAEIGPKESLEKVTVEVKDTPKGKESTGLTKVNDPVPPKSSGAVESPTVKQSVANDEKIKKLETPVKTIDKQLREEKKESAVVPTPVDSFTPATIGTKSAEQKTPSAEPLKVEKIEAKDAPLKQPEVKKIAPNEPAPPSPKLPEPLSKKATPAIPPESKTALVSIPSKPSTLEQKPLEVSSKPMQPLQPKLGDPLPAKVPPGKLVGMRKKPADLKRPTEEVDFWSTIGTRETVSFARRKQQLGQLLRSTEEEDSPPASPSQPAQSLPGSPTIAGAKVKTAELGPTPKSPVGTAEVFRLPVTTEKTVPKKSTAVADLDTPKVEAEPPISKGKQSIVVDSAVSGAKKVEAAQATTKTLAEGSEAAKVTVQAKMKPTTLPGVPSSKEKMDPVSESTSPTPKLVSVPEPTSPKAKSGLVPEPISPLAKIAPVPEPASPKAKIASALEPASPKAKIASDPEPASPKPKQPATLPEKSLSKLTLAKVPGAGQATIPLATLDTKKLSPKELIKAVAPNIAAAAEKKLAQEKGKPNDSKRLIGDPTTTPTTTAPTVPSANVRSDDTKQPAAVVDEPPKKVIVKKVIKVVKAKAGPTSKAKSETEVGAQAEQEQQRRLAQQQQHQQQQNLERMKTKLNQITLNMGVKGMEVEVKECHKCQSTTVSEALPEPVAIVTAAPKASRQPIANGAAKLTKNKFGTLDNLSDLSAVDGRERNTSQPGVATAVQSKQKSSSVTADQKQKVFLSSSDEEQGKAPTGAAAARPGDNDSASETSFSGVEDDWSSEEEEEEDDDDEMANDKPEKKKPFDPTKRVKLNFDQMRKCYSKEEKSPIVLVARPRPLWKVKRHGHRHNRKADLTSSSSSSSGGSGHSSASEDESTSTSTTTSSGATTGSSGNATNTSEAVSTLDGATSDINTDSSVNSSTGGKSKGGKQKGGQTKGKTGQKGKPDPFGDIYDNPMVIPLHAEPRTSSRKSGGGSFVAPLRDENNNTPADLDEDERARSIGAGHEVRSASTSSHDSGFYGGGTAPISPKKALDCDVNCHKKCEKLAANLCGVNQKLIVEALSSVRRGVHEARDSPSKVPPSANPAYRIEAPVPSGVARFEHDCVEGGGGTASSINAASTSSSGNSGPAASTAKEEEIDLDTLEEETSYTYAQFQKTGKLTAPATVIPRFRKYNVDDFHFLTVLGKGSFGKVFLAELKNSDYYYAIKCLKKDVVLEDDDVDCTLIERKVLALGTKHPFLCHLFCTFQTDSHLFFVMEYLNGGDLMFHIQQSGRFPEARARFYAAEIVSGLKFLHRKGIGQKYNQAVDWWSFGVLVYEMLVGQSPFSGCDEDELFWSICNEIPWFPHYLSKEALRLLQSLLEKDASIRLGVLNTMDEESDIKYHPFFNSIIWDKLERRAVEPPFKPQVRHPLDTQYFDKQFTRERARLTPIDRNILASMDQAQFEGFTYTNPNNTLTKMREKQKKKQKKMYFCPQCGDMKVTYNNF